MDRDMTNSKFQASQMPIKQRIQQIDVSTITMYTHIIKLYVLLRLSYLTWIVFCLNS